MTTLLGGPATRSGAAEIASAEHLLLLDEAGIRPRQPSSSVRRREAGYRYALLAGDLIAGFVAIEAALSVTGTSSPLRAAALALPVIVVLAKLHGLYDRDDVLLRKTTIDEVPRLFQHASLATLILVLSDEPLGIGQISDAQAATLWALLLGTACAGRLLARRLAAGFSAPERCLVLGDVASAEDLRARTAGRRNIDVVGAASMRDLRTFRDLCCVIDEHRADRLIVVQSADVPQDQTLELVRVAKTAGVRVSILPGILGVVGTQVEFDDVFGVTLLGIRRFGLSRSSQAVKRLFDIALSVPLLLLASPVLLVCAIAIRRDTPGPALFRQERVGRRGRRFQIVKLRTMVDGAEEQREALMERNEAGDGLFKIVNDPRITRLGTMLRRLHLDEVPQLWNVLRGEMSLVGPRPLVTYEDALIMGLDRRRVELTPGMTGPWQIMGGHRRIPMSEMVKLDYLYAASWSLWNDVKILLRTVSIVARRHGV